MVDATFIHEVFTRILLFFGTDFYNSIILNQKVNVKEINSDEVSNSFLVNN